MGAAAVRSLPGVCDDIMAVVGGTPLVRLGRLFADCPFEVLAKLESLNPGGSVKDRPARAIIEAALADGQIGPDTVIVESSSGNMGIGLAQACRFYGLRFICVVDVKSTEQNVRILRTYGADIVMVKEPDPETGELLRARLAEVERLQREIPNSFWPNQYTNQNNSRSHYQETMREVDEALDGKVDFLFCATSTCGTIRGCGEYLFDHGMSTRMIAVDAHGSLIFQDCKRDRSIPGIGAGMRPLLCDPTAIHRVIHVDDGDCIEGCRRLVETEGILAGGSSGGVVTAVRRMAPDIPAGSVCVAVLPDRGERYLDTVYDDDWVRRTVPDAAVVERLLGKARPDILDHLNRRSVR